MAFSIRNLFGNDKPSDHASLASSSANSTVAEAKNTSGHNPFNGTATNGHAFGGNMLFKTAATAPQPTGQPVSSPFKPASSQPAGLTVGDILPQLPADALRNISIPTNQPLQLAEEVLEHALRSGQAMLPIFEIYRVCPALFQFPISPQDPRMIPLPTHKLAQISQLLQGKILSTPPAVEPTPAAPNVPSQPHSPFGTLSQTSPPQTSGSPFTPFGASAQQLAADYLPSPLGTTLPQKKTPFGPVNKTEQAPVGASPATSGPLPFAPVPKAVGETAPHHPFAPAPPASGRPQGILSSPFAALQSEEDAPWEPSQPQAAPSPFGIGQPAVSEPFSYEEQLAPSPFAASLPTAPSTVQSPAPVSANPFARIQALARKEAPQQAPAAPVIAEIPATTFENPIFPSEPVAPVQSLGSAQTSAPAGEESLKMSLATLLENCSARDLGIGPELIPSWVQTSLPLAGLRKQFASGRVFVTIRELSEGLSPEFRSLLGAANPDFKVELPVNEVFHALLAPAYAEEQIAEVPSLEAFPSVPTHSDFKASEQVPNLISSADENPHANWAPAFPAFTAPKEEIPQNEVLESFPLAAAPVASTPVKSTPNVPSRPAQNQRSSSGQLLWRVLLGARENLDAEGVIKLTHSQLGVSAAVCLRDGDVLFASGTGTPEANRFIQQAAQICQHLQPLIELTGIQDTETFSIKNDHYVLTFSVQENVTLAVMHEPLAEEQSMKEKITLIARELAGMLPENS